MSENENFDSDQSMLTGEECEVVRQLVVEQDRLHANRAERAPGLAREKQDFPIGIRPDGSLNLIETLEKEEDRADRSPRGAHPQLHGESRSNCLAEAH